MSRDWRLYLEDIEASCSKIERFTHGLDFENFVADERTDDAVLRNLEVIGEAAKRVPEDVRLQMLEVPWRAIAGFRDFVAHAYFAVDDEIVWNTVHLEVRSCLKRCACFCAFIERSRDGSGRGGTRGAPSLPSPSAGHETSHLTTDLRAHTRQAPVARAD